MCDQSRLEKVVSLTPTPPGNNFLREEDLSQPEPTYPLELYFCASCHHVQLGHVVDPRILYQNSTGSDGAPSVVTVVAGEMIFTPPMEDHATVFLDETEMLVVSRNPRDQASYESDVRRVILVDPATAKVCC